MSNFESLKIWNNAREIVKGVYKMMEDHKDFGFRDQIQRAAVSIMNNIAEGKEYGSDKMFNRYLLIAKGSCAEVKSMLYLCEDLGICDAKDANKLREMIENQIHAIQKFISYINNENNQK